jgi:hypothetical protein
MCLNCKEGNTLLFPERPVFGSALWLEAVRAVSIQEDYVKSLERKLEDPNRDIMQRNFIESLIGSAKAKLLQLRDALKEIDEGG